MNPFLFTLLRVLVFACLTLVGSVRLTAFLYGANENTMGTLALLLTGFLFIGLPFYALFDFIATSVRRRGRFATQGESGMKISGRLGLMSLLYPMVFGLIASLFFAYAAFRLA